MSTTKEYIHLAVKPHELRPLAYKKIDRKQFEERGYKVEYDSIVPDQDGFISKQIVEKVNPDKPSTIVFNIGVGQGKTTSVFEIIKNIAKKDKYIIIVALPFRSLIEKYTSKSINLVGKENVSSYLDFDEILEGTTRGSDDGLIQSFEKSLPLRASKKVQIITVNGLLGNPGDAIQQAKVKRSFFSEIRKYCKDNDKRVIFIFDEIHETVHNFKDEYILTLRLWKDITHKALILTATYTEASFIAVMHIAYLTGKKIQIVECDRIKVPDSRIANLHLYFTKEAYSSRRLEEFDFIEEMLKDKEYKRGAEAICPPYFMTLRGC